MPRCQVVMRGAYALTLFNGGLTSLLVDARRQRVGTTTKSGVFPLLQSHQACLLVNLEHRWAATWSDGAGATHTGCITDAPILQAAFQLPRGPYAFPPKQQWGLIPLERQELSFQGVTDTHKLSTLANVTIPQIKGTLDKNCLLAKAPSRAVLARVGFAAGVLNDDTPSNVEWELLEPDSPLSGTTAPKYYVSTYVLFDIDGSGKFAIKSANLDPGVQDFRRNWTLAPDSSAIPASAPLEVGIVNLEFQKIVSKAVPRSPSLEPDRDFEFLYDLREPSTEPILLPHPTTAVASAIAMGASAAGGGDAARCMPAKFIK